MGEEKTSGPSSSGDGSSRSGKSDSSDGSSMFEDENIDTSCGYFRCKPDCLQKCAQPRFLLVCMCLFVLVESFIQWGIVNINMATWERRFQLGNKQSAWIVTSQDVASGVLAPIFGYLGTYYHKGRIITVGAICMFVSCSLFLVPHFASNTYELYGGYGTDTCALALNSNSTEFDRCLSDDVDTNMSRWLALFCFCQVLFGFTSMSMWTIGITYLDENVKRENSALFIGLLNTLGAVGACLGFIGGGLFLEIYVDIGRVDMDDVTIDPSDPRWVGGWWIGFALAAILTIPSMFLMPCFPKELPAAAKFRAKSKSEAYKGMGNTETKRENFGQTCSDLGASLKFVFGNPVFDLITLGGIFEVGAVSAFAAFLPKILQFQFALTSSQAAMVAGAILVPGAAVGQLLGGIIPKVGKFNFRGLMWMLITAQLICVGCAAGFLAKCPTPRIAGFNVEYPLNSSEEYSDPFVQSCNVDCNCTTYEYSPICTEDGTAYFSPCHGACQTKTEVDGVTMFTDCACLPPATNLSDWGPYQAQQGICKTDCKDFWIFMPLLLIIILATFVENTGGFAATLRVVPQKQRAFAFGVQAPIIRYLGNVPFPILFGAIFDRACIVWQDNCGSRGSCWIYDTEFVAMGNFIGCIVVKGVSAICFIIAVCIYKTPDEHAEEIKDETIIDAFTDGRDSKEASEFSDKIGNGEKPLYLTNGAASPNGTVLNIADEYIGTENKAFQDERGVSPGDNIAVSTRF